MENDNFIARRSLFQRIRRQLEASLHPPLQDPSPSFHNSVFSSATLLYPCKESFIHLPLIIVCSLTPSSATQRYPCKASFIHLPSIIMCSLTPSNATPLLQVRNHSPTFHHCVFIAIVPIHSRVSSTWQLTCDIKF